MSGRNAFVTLDQAAEIQEQTAGRLQCQLDPSLPLDQIECNVRRARNLLQLVGADTTILQTIPGQPPQTPETNDPAYSWRITHDTGKDVRTAARYSMRISLDMGVLGRSDSSLSQSGTPDIAHTWVGYFNRGMARGLRGASYEHFIMRTGVSAGVAGGLIVATSGLGGMYFGEGQVGAGLVISAGLLAGVEWVLSSADRASGHNHAHGLTPAIRFDRVALTALTAGQARLFRVRQSS